VRPSRPATAQFFRPSAAFLSNIERAAPPPRHGLDFSSSASPIRDLFRSCLARNQNLIVDARRADPWPRCSPSVIRRRDPGASYAGAEERLAPARASFSASSRTGRISRSICHRSSTREMVRSRPWRASGSTSSCGGFHRFAPLGGADRSRRECTSPPFIGASSPGAMMFLVQNSRHLFSRPLLQPYPQREAGQHATLHGSSFNTIHFPPRPLRVIIW